MRRFQLLEIEDQSWCPASVRNAVTDFLQFLMATTKPYAPVVPVLASALQRTQARQILDLCSGGAGPWLWLLPALADAGATARVCLTDKYPNPGVLQNRDTDSDIRYYSHSVDAVSVPAELEGFRTMFTAFHHFPPAHARAILEDAVRRRRGIAIFETTRRSALAMLLMCFAPLLALVGTPWIRPFRWSRLVWTYLIPLVPLLFVFDGLVSCFRTYTMKELRHLTSGLGDGDYQWEIGSLKSSRSFIPITYLIGVPSRSGS